MGRTSRSRVEEVLRSIRSDPVFADRLYTLDAIDTKVSALIQFVGIMIAALLVFASGGALRDIADGSGHLILVRTLMLAALLALSTSALIALSCIWIVSIDALARNKSESQILDRLTDVAVSRRMRYKVAFAFAAIGLLSTIVSVGLPLAAVLGPGT